MISSTLSVTDLLTDYEGIVPHKDSTAIQEMYYIDMEAFHNEYNWVQQQTLPYRFLVLKDEWMQATQFLSSITEICMHPAYQKIIGMGPEVLPLILKELRENSGYWFWALKAISGEDPGNPLHKGKVTKMAEDWIAWGMKQGHL